MIRRTVAAALIGLIVGVVLVLPGTARAETGDVVAVGWWTRLPTAGAPDGGVAVGAAPDGPTSVAAVRVDLGDGVRALTVAATEAGGSPETASLQVCGSSDDWQPAAGGALADAPALDCAAAVTFVRGGGGVWSADVTSLVDGRSGTVSLGLRALGPGGDDPLGVAPSEVRFDAPTATATPVPSRPAPTSPPTTTAPAGATPTTRPAATSPSPSPPVTPRSTTPSTTPATDDDAVVAFPQPTTTTTIPLTEERALPAVTSAGVASGEGRPVGEAVVLVALACAIGAGVGGASKLREVRAA